MLGNMQCMSWNKVLQESQSRLESPFEKYRSLSTVRFNYKPGLSTM
jgi:hypothetical protein